jgi:hypothetical protein
MGKEAVVAYLRKYLGIFLRGTEDNHHNLQSARPVLGPIFEPVATKLQVYRTTFLSH